MPKNISTSTLRSLQYATRYINSSISANATDSISQFAALQSILFALENLGNPKSGFDSERSPGNNTDRIPENIEKLCHASRRLRNAIAHYQCGIGNEGMLELIKELLPLLAKISNELSGITNLAKQVPAPKPNKPPRHEITDMANDYGAMLQATKLFVRMSTACPDYLSSTYQNNSGLYADIGFDKYMTFIMQQGIWLKNLGPVDKIDGPLKLAVQNCIGSMAEALAQVKVLHSDKYLPQEISSLCDRRNQLLHVGEAEKMPEAEACRLIKQVQLAFANLNEEYALLSNDVAIAVNDLRHNTAKPGPPIDKTTADTAQRKRARGDEEEARSWQTASHTASEALISPERLEEVKRTQESAAKATKDFYAKQQVEQHISHGATLLQCSVKQPTPELKQENIMPLEEIKPQPKNKPS